MKVFKATVAVAALMTALSMGSLALAAAGTPAAGSVRLYLTPTSETKSTVVVTGAIGDFGAAVTTNKQGTIDANGSYEKVTLKQGSFEINATAFEKGIQRARPHLNNVTCTVDLSGHGGGTLFAGKGLYQEISGKLDITFVIGGVAPRFTSGPKKGQCDLRQNGPAAAFYEGISARGKVKFS
jgi:hypothetical protein